MLTTIIILSVICAMLLTIDLMQYSILTKRDNLVSSIRDCVQEYEHTIGQREKEIAEANARHNAFSIAGDTLHGISCIVEQGIPHYAPLIEKLGEIARSAYIVPDMPLYRCLNSEACVESDYGFPMLDERQNKTLKLMLKQIANHERQPEELLELISHLLYTDDFDLAMQMTIKIQSKCRQ